MTVLTNRLNTETGCKLVREGGTMTQSEKERFGKSAMVRYVSGIDQPIYPIAYIKNKIPMAKKTAICSYTADGWALIHTNLSLNSFVLAGLRKQPSGGRSTELTDSRISLFSAQRGKCAYFDSVPCRPFLLEFSASILYQPHFQKAMALKGAYQ